MNHSKLNLEEANKATVRRIYQECLNQGNLEVADQLIAPGYVNQSANGGTGPESFKEMANHLRSAFPDIHFTIHDLIAENDRVVVSWTWEGTHQGRFNQFSPTGKRVQQEGNVIYRLEGEKVVDVKVQVDRFGFLQQLGVIPQTIASPAGAGPTRPQAR